MAKKPGSKSKTSASKAAPKLEKKTLRSLTSKNRSDSKIVGGRASAYSCGINCSTSQDPT